MTFGCDMAFTEIIMCKYISKFHEYFLRCEIGIGDIENQLSELTETLKLVLPLPQFTFATKH